MHPGRQRLVALVGVALVVHGEQAFLDEVFHFIGPAEQALAQKSAQVRAQFLQELAVRAGVAIEAAKEQAAQGRFRVARCRPAVYGVSCHRAGRLQPGEKRLQGIVPRPRGEACAKLPRCWPDSSRTPGPTRRWRRRTSWASRCCSAACWCSSCAPSAWPASCRRRCWRASRCAPPCWASACAR
ncbi:hypothetical protein D3C72_1748530 [compost metagenome]